jgi:hypothetical protein
MGAKESGHRSVFSGISQATTGISIIRRLARAITIATVLSGMFCACVFFKHGATAPSLGSSDSSAGNEPPPGPEAKINISYSKPSDYLSSLVVTKYSAANTIATEPKGKGIATTVLFQGGVVVWQVDISPSTFSGIPGLGSRQPYVVRHVKYGEIPQGFQQTEPDGGSPEPLEPDNYYIFSVIRASGSTNYEAVKVEGDGSLIAYEADPRAGDSFQLCCNVAPDFTVTAAGSENAGPPGMTPDSDSFSPADGGVPDGGNPESGADPGP